jgi:hypothetical protein
VSVVLPPEILDKILEAIPTDSGGKRTLIACALVATWWTGSSQRCLFTSVSINDKNYERWINGVVLSDSKSHLLRHVRSFVQFFRRSDGKYPMRNLLRDSGQYLSALHNIHSLALHGITLEHIGDEAFHGCFSAFRETLTELTLGFFVTSFSVFVTLIAYFPNATTLRLALFGLRSDEGLWPE